MNRARAALLRELGETAGTSVFEAPDHKVAIHYAEQPNASAAASVSGR